MFPEKEEFLQPWKRNIFGLTSTRSHCITGLQVQYMLGGKSMLGSKARVGFIIWCVTWPVAVVAILTEGGSPTTWFFVFKSAAVLDVLAFYVIGTVWLVSRVRDSARTGSASLWRRIAACALFLYLSFFGPVAIPVCGLVLPGPSK